MGTEYGRKGEKNSQTDPFFPSLVLFSLIGPGGGRGIG